MEGHPARPADPSTRARRLVWASAMFRVAAIHTADNTWQDRSAEALDDARALDASITETLPPVVARLLRSLVLDDQ